MKFWKTGIILLILIILFVSYLETTSTKQPLPDEKQKEVVDQTKSSPESNSYWVAPTPYLRRDAVITTKTKKPYPQRQSANLKSNK